MTEEPRFFVGTVTGRLGPRTSWGPGISAYVYDRVYNCEVIATYRSETRPPRTPKSIVVEQAFAHTARLNRKYGS